MRHQVQILVIFGCDESTEVYILVLVCHFEIAHLNSIGSTVEDNFVVLIHRILTIDIPRIPFEIYE